MKRTMTKSLNDVPCELKRIAFFIIVNVGTSEEDAYH